MIRENLLRKKIYKERQEKKINIVIRIIFFFLFIISITGCDKSALNTDSFTSKLENKNYSVIDISDNSKKEVLAVGIHYQVYFYEFESSSKAKKELKKIIKKYNNVNNIVKTEKDNYIEYIIQNNNVYTVYYLVDNTYIFISTTKKYSKDVLNLLKYLDY